MPGITVRFGESSLQQIKDEAKREGLSAGAYIREAALIRLAFAMALRGETPPEANEALIAALREAGAFGDSRRSPSP